MAPAPETVTVLVSTKTHNGSTPLCVNGVTANVKAGVPTRIPVVLLAALDDSAVAYELVADEPQAEAETQAEAGPAPDAELLKLLDGTVATIGEALPLLDRAQLETLLAAETAGKTRKGVLEAINDLLETLVEPLQPAPEEPAAPTDPAAPEGGETDPSAATDGSEGGDAA